MERIHWFQQVMLRHVNVYLCFAQEKFLFPTNKPNKHKVLFYEAVQDFCLFKLREQSVLSYDEPPQPTPLLRKYLKNVCGWLNDDIDTYLQDYTFVLRNMDEIAGLETKDDELFPPPQPIRAEAAGAILNFTTDEAVLIVYADCSYTGKTVELDMEERALNKGLRRAGISKVQILERSSGDINVCAAIFNHIPFVTDEARNKELALQETYGTVSAYLPNHVEEKINLFRGQVNELDWRGWK